MTSAAPVSQPSARLVRGHARARLVGWVVYLYIATVVAQAAANVWLVRLLDRVQTAGAVADDTYLFRLPARVGEEAVAALGGPIQTYARIVDGAGLLAGVALLVVTLRWAGWAREIAERSGAVGMRYGAVARVLCWIVPVWSFFGPKQVVNDLWAASDPSAGLPVRVLAVRSEPRLLGWWILVLAVPPLTWAANAVASYSTLGGVRFAQYLLLVAGAASVVACVAWVAIVRRISERQAQRAANLGLLIG